VCDGTGDVGSESAWGIPVSGYTLTLTIGGIAERPGVVSGQVVPREYLSVTVSADHEVVDGAPLARFGTRLKLVESAAGLTTTAR